MCNHSWKNVNDVWICSKCGLTRLPTGQVIFDKRYPDIIKKKSKRKKVKK